MKRLRILSKLLTLVVAGLLASVVCPRAGAATVLDNSSTSAGFLSQGKLEFGNEFIPGNLNGSPSMAITNFAFEYYSLANGSTSGSMSFRADVRFYLNDGPMVNGRATPGSLIFDSGTINLRGATSGKWLTFDSETDFQYDNNGYWSDTYGGLWAGAAQGVTWTIQFSNLRSTDTAGIVLYSPADAGTEYADYWLNTAGTWSLETNTNGVSTGGATMSATPVPEPGSLSLAALGGLTLMVMRRRSRA